MNAPLAAVSPAKVMPGRVLIRGKLEKSSRRSGKRFSVVVMPAADEYSRPQSVEIRSNGESLGEVGDVVSIDCVLGGYPLQPFDYTDKDGQRKTGQKYVLTLDAVE